MTRIVPEPMSMEAFMQLFGNRVVHADHVTGAMKWFKFDLNFQMGSVGCDIDRAIRARNAGDSEGARGAFYRALELFNCTLKDPKNKQYLDELTTFHEAFVDHFLGINAAQTTDQYWSDYFMAHGTMHGYLRDVSRLKKTSQRQSQTSPQTPQ